MYKLKKLLYNWGITAKHYVAKYVSTILVKVVISLKNVVIIGVCSCKNLLEFVLVCSGHHRIVEKSSLLWDDLY